MTAPEKPQIAKMTTQTIKLLPYSGNSFKIWSFLGWSGSYRHFLQGFPKIAAPINRKLKKEKPPNFVLKALELRAVDELKNHVVSIPDLDLPRANGKFIVYTDSSDAQIGCVFPQKQEKGALQSVRYWSRSLCDAERRYDITRKECLAVVWSVFMLSLYRKDSHANIQTEHKALRSILELK